MRKSKRFYPVRLSADALRAAYQAFLDVLPDEQRSNLSSHMVAEIDDAEWTHDSDEELFADYRRGAVGAVFQKSAGAWSLRIQLVNGVTTYAAVECPTRVDVERVFEVLESQARASEVPLPPAKPQPITLFIGHGRSADWRDVKDHLHDQHGYQVIAYEVGARAGHAVRDILEDMLGKSSFALLVLTAEDESADGTLRARQNVVHELGLFQGRLGFSRAIAIVEEGTDTFSNIGGIQQIRYPRGHVRETYGEILATLMREFGALARER